MEYYVGRLTGDFTPSFDQWKMETMLAEALLINAHGPAYNSTHILAVNESNPDVQNARVLNWGSVRSLSREVSGMIWSSKAGKRRNRPFHGVAPPQPEGEPPVLTG